MRGELELEDIAFCPHCSNRAPQLVTGTSTNYTTPSGGSNHYVATQCSTCRESLLYKRHDKQHSELKLNYIDLSEFTLVWPTHDDLHKCVPEKVRSCYAEASAIRNVAPNAFANQIRRTLEALCKDRSAISRTLAQNLKELADRGEIPPKLADMTDVLRMIGNIGSHAGDEDVHAEFVPVIDGFLRAIVEYVYVAPHRVSEFQNRLDYVRKGGK